MALTSNQGSADFQNQTIGNEQLFEKVLNTSKQWGDDQNLMYVVGATRADMLQKVRAIVPNNFLLVPGVGAQGGSLEEVSKYGMNNQCGLLVNSSRAIIYASNTADFAKKAGEEAQKVQLEMRNYLDLYMAN